MRNIMRRMKSALNAADIGKERALISVIRFFAIMLLLTILARGVAGAVLPVVEVAQASRRELTDSFEAQGVAEYGAVTAMRIAQGLDIISVPVREGDTVSEGQILAVVDGDSLETKLKLAKAELVRLQVQKAQLNGIDEPETAAISYAQEQLDTAYAAYAKAELAGDKDAMEAATAAARQAEYARDEALAAYNRAVKDNESKDKANAAERGVLQQSIADKQAHIAQLTEVKANGMCILASVGGTLQGLCLTAGGVTPQYCNIATADEGYVLSLVLSRDAADKLVSDARIAVTQGERKATVTQISAVPHGDSVTLSAALPKAIAWQQGAVQCNIELARAQYDLCLPAQAICTDKKGSFVYVIEQKPTVLGLCDTAVRREVTVLHTAEGYAAVGGTITAEDKISVFSTRILSADARVRINA